MKNIDPELLSQLRDVLMAEMQVKFPALRAGTSDGVLGETGPLAVNASTDRRGMLKTMGVMAAGVAAVGLLRPTSSSAAPRYLNGGSKEGAVPDASGGNFIIGQANSASADADITSLINPGTTLSPILLRVDNYASGVFTPLSGSIISIAGIVKDAGATPTGQILYGVYGSAAATTTDAFGYGVFGTGNIGVSGEGSGNGCGVDGDVTSTATDAFGVRGSASSGVGGAFSGGRAALVLSTGNGAVANPNISLPSGSSAGDLYRGSTNGSVWYNAGGTNPYRRLADSTTAGALTPFAAAGRFVNTITGSGAPYAGQHLTGGTTAAYQISGVTVNGVTVPTTARAIIGRIANPNPSGAGNLLVGATNPPVGGVLAIVAGAPQNSFFFSALDASGVLYVKNSGSGSTDIIIDIQGYYL